MMNERIEQYLQEHRQAFEQDLCQLVRIPSVSSDSRHRQDIQQAAQWIADQLRRLGLTVQLVDAGGHPIVWAESPPVPGAPTALVYGHYDVQPPDPLDQWRSPPFEPTVRDGNLYGRGATDDKGQMLTHVKSAQAWLETEGRLPVQLRYVIEGEEEVGSPSLLGLVEGTRTAAGFDLRQLACDVIVISDMSQFAPGQPAITYGLKGIAYYELRLRGPRQDLHSGSFGGAVANPANTLARMLAALIDDQGRVQIPGFYDDVQPLSDEERRQLAALPFDEQAFMQRLGVGALAGEAGYTTLERRWTRPTFDINGLWSGYQGEGAKTIVPATAGAKFSFRLVPDQQPDRIAVQLRQMLQQLCPPGIEMELIDFHGCPGLVVPLDSPYVAAAARAIEHAFGRKPVFIREGGSIPVVSAMHQRLAADPLLLGWGLDDDNTHGPNEKFCLADFHRGPRPPPRLWYELSQLQCDEAKADGCQS